MYYACPDIPIKDNRFFDNQFQEKGPNFLHNDWFLHSSEPLQESIQKYAKFPISTIFEDKNNNKHHQEPRFLVVSVDVAEGMTVTFDSYPKADCSRKTEYGRYLKKEDGKEIGFEHVIRYNDGITIDQVMASGTLPEFYYYARVPTIEIQQKNVEDKRCITDKSKDSNTRYFWDGGLLSNTPLIELLDAHRQYWTGVQNKGKIPGLDVYIVNVHPSKIDISILPEDYDGVKDRNKDILYGDRTSHYAEKMAHLITDYAEFVTQMRDLVDEAIYQVNDDNKKRELHERLEAILSTKTISKDSKDEARKYEDLIGDEFNLKVVMRIERTNYINSISLKTGDLTLETINKLIKEGKCDAWFSIIRKEINDIKLGNSDRNELVKILDEAIQNLRNNDYEDNDSETYHLLSKFIRTVENKDKSKAHESAKLVKSAKALMAILD
jgi:NTE family protein